jgi:hypothetical protein
MILDKLKNCGGCAKRRAWIRAQYQRLRRYVDLEERDQEQRPGGEIEDGPEAAPRGP